MPNFDTGHYFLTALVPIRDGMTTDAGGVEVTFIQNLRATLAVLPTALQSPATEMIGINSPFARDRSTHFAPVAHGGLGGNQIGAKIARGTARDQEENCRHCGAETVLHN
ncbi:MAG: hypothetical protein AAGJ92_06375, partial [Pseudomonadota bacterium]